MVGRASPSSVPPRLLCRPSWAYPVYGLPSSSGGVNDPSPRSATGDKPSSPPSFAIWAAAFSATATAALLAEPTGVRVDPYDTLGAVAAAQRSTNRDPSFAVRHQNGAVAVLQQPRAARDRRRPVAIRRLPRCRANPARSGATRSNAGGVGTGYPAESLPAPRPCSSSTFGGIGAGITVSPLTLSAGAAGASVAVRPAPHAAPGPLAARSASFGRAARSTGRLADPTDLAFDESHLDDPDALNATVDELLTRKPHLASRRPTGEIGQGASPPAASSVDLAALLRQRAR